MKLIYWHGVVVKESAAFITGAKQSPGQLVLKKAELSGGFQQSIFNTLAGEPFLSHFFKWHLCNSIMNSIDWNRVSEIAGLFYLC